MLHPVGSRPPSVYWIRRGMLLALVALILVSVYAIFLRGGGNEKPKSGPGFTATGSTTAHSSSAPPQTSSSTSSSNPATSASSSTPAPKACTAAQLTVAASTSAKSYPAGAKPVVAIVVTNTGSAPCVQDLADGQIELRVFNGSARVWGSHDCAIQPGTADAVLPVKQPIRREVQWSGLSSQPACAGTRTRVGAGTYTLHALLAGREGTTTTFTLAG